MVTSLQCLPEWILVHYQFKIQHLRKTPEIVAKKIKAMKDNKSPGVDAIPSKLLMETVEQISISLARMFNLSLKEGVVPFELIEGKKPTSYHYLIQEIPKSVEMNTRHTSRVTVLERY